MPTVGGSGYKPEAVRRVHRALMKYYLDKGCTKEKAKELMYRWLYTKGMREPIIQ